MGRAGDEEGFSGRSASEEECTPTSTNPPSENESEGMETVKEDPSSQEKDGESVSTAREPEALVKGLEREEASLTEKAKPEPVGENLQPKEPPTEEQPIGSPTTTTVTALEQPEGFLQGLLEIHSKPNIECILSTSEPPLLGVE